MTDAERAIYETTYFSRGPETVATAGIFEMAHDLHCAAQVLGRIASRRGAGTSDEQHKQRAGILAFAQALIISERNMLLDEFHRRWTPEGRPELK